MGAGNAANVTEACSMRASKCSQLDSGNIRGQLPCGDITCSSRGAPTNDVDCACCSSKCCTSSSQIGFVGEMATLEYSPPPQGGDPCHRDAYRALGGLTKPRRPAFRRHQDRSVNISPPALLSPHGTCARPGDPLNQAYVFVTTDLAGFLPYTILMSEDHGIEFSSLSASPDFQVDPVNLIKVERTKFEILMCDTFFASLCKGVLARQGKPVVNNALASLPPEFVGADDEFDSTTQQECVRPPYTFLVLMSVKRKMYEGGLVLIVIAVQSDHLAEELRLSCCHLKKLCATKFCFLRKGLHDDELDRGCRPVTSPTRTPLVVSP